VNEDEDIDRFERNINLCCFTY